MNKYKHLSNEQLLALIKEMKTRSLLKNEYSYQEINEVAKIYANRVNEKSAEIAKKFGMKPKKLSHISLLRSL